MLVLALVLTALLLVLLVRDIRRTSALPHLGAVEVLPQASATILIPARNEAERIRPCLDGALTQRYPNYEVLVLDDGSTDATPQILAARRAEQAHSGGTPLQVLAGAPLPLGWAGKCYACQQAAAAARSEWLLFLDADTAPHADLLAALIQHAEQRGLDLLSIWPYLELGSFSERLIMPPFLMLIQGVYPLEQINADDVRPDGVLANGQCLLVRRSVYEAIGGHGAVRAALLEDVELAQQVRAAGFRVGVAEGMALLRVRMYTNGRQVVEGLTKNAVPGLRNGGPRSWWSALRLLLLAYTPLWLLGLGLYQWTDLGLQVQTITLLILGCIALAASYGYYAIRLRLLHRISPWNALLWPAGVMAYFAITVRAAWLILRGRGVSWKGRAYVG